jgi:hypothetical protein
MPRLVRRRWGLFSVGVDEYCLHVTCLINMRDTASTYCLSLTHSSCYLYSDRGRPVAILGFLCLRTSGQGRNLGTWRLLPYRRVCVKLWQQDQMLQRLSLDTILSQFYPFSYSHNPHLSALKLSHL